MSSGTVAENDLRELATDEAVVRESAEIHIAVLRRALAIAAHERAESEGHPENGPIYRLTWVMEASEKVLAGLQELKCE